MPNASDADPRELVKAVVAGDIERIAKLLGTEPDLANATLPGNQRSMLHYANDWPGHRPNIATTIELLVGAGADPNVRFPHPDSADVAETPLHWAASNGDVAAVEALLDLGAEVDILGGIFDGCTAYAEAIIFEKYDAARLLLERGAADWLPGVAALGRSEEIAGYFDDSGELRTDIGMLPHWSEPPPAQMLIDRAFQFACRAGHLDIAQDLLHRGADPRSVMPGDTTALDEARGNEHADVVVWLESVLDTR